MSHGMQFLVAGDDHDEPAMPCHAQRACRDDAPWNTGHDTPGKAVRENGDGMTAGFRTAGPGRSAVWKRGSKSLSCNGKFLSTPRAGW